MPITQFWGAVLAIDVDIRGTEREKRPDGTNCVVIVWRVRLGYERNVITPTGLRSSVGG